jgi:hypothetical protein
MLQFEGVMIGEQYDPSFPDVKEIETLAVQLEALDGRRRSVRHG